MNTSRQAIRYQGKITTWKDEQGFGFIAPNGGGPLVFVHIKSFANRGKRPADNDVVTYELSVNAKGQPRADSVAYVRDGASKAPPPRAGASSMPMFIAAGFLGALTILVLIGRLPAMVLGAYLALSIMTYIAYAIDKSAAQNNEWRTQESTLHLLGLACGWPGALVAQKVYRHKSSKQTFQTAFWFTVAVNCAALGWLLSSHGAGLRRTIISLP